MASIGMPGSEPPDPRTALASHPLDPAARAWLDEAVTRIGAKPSAIRALFPAARRRCGSARLDEHWTVDEAARALLIVALPLTGDELAAELAGLFRHGDPAEQRAVLRALPLLDGDYADDTAGDPAELLHDRALPLVREALRGNDNSVIEAALGAYGAAWLTDDEYRQAVLKCVFCEIPLDRIAGLDTRADVRLAEMLGDFAHERVAAGRDVPADVWRVTGAPPTLVERLTEETRATVPARREAAERALKALDDMTATTAAAQHTEEEA
ncbi:EboA domain-containing protein [Streptomyces sp. NPDC002643]